MTKFVIIIRAEAMLARGTRDAVIGTIDLMSSAQDAVRLLQARGMAATIQHTLEDDAEPAPAVRRTRKPRAALGSGPLATPQQNDAETMARQYEEIKNRKPPRDGLPPTTGADGEDLLAIPPHLVRS